MPLAAPGAGAQGTGRRPGKPPAAPGRRAAEAHGADPAGHPQAHARNLGPHGRALGVLRWLAGRVRGSRGPGGGPPRQRGGAAPPGGSGDEEEERDGAGGEFREGSRLWGTISHATVANYAQVGEFLEICKEITRSSGSPWLFKFEEWLDWWGALKNPKGTRCVDKLVESPYFQVACALIILANTVFVAIDANTQMENYVHTVSETSHTKAQQSIFLVLYIIELFLRGASEGRYFFYGENMKWNWFDMGIIVTSILSDFVMSQNSLSFLRVARILKVVKVSRVFRGLRHAGLGELQRMVTQVTGSLRSLVGCFALLAFITYVFAIFFVYSLCDLPSVDDEHLEGILEFFGSVAQTMLTLLQATTGGLDWRDVYAVLSEAGSLVAFCFILYVLFFVIAVWNIIMDYRYVRREDVENGQTR
ncbi:unnamed protein product [Prorocentrum cordatum]|uniref:Ion transport domain-containing protein n=1 Tax=Prorocentrum cordatum TaxID=2364126 RepID=A0ABN9T6E8_9DINO|nr:unnamed protein product [Polarella glacialis]